MGQIWNWQQADWPHFRYDPDALTELEAEFLQHSGVLIGALTHLQVEEKQLLTIDVLCDEALKTSEIEGEYLNRDSVQSSMRRSFGLETARGKIPPAEQGVAEMILDVYRSFETPLTHVQLYSWQAMLMKGRNDIAEVGCYRTQGDPMQVVSGPLHRLHVHFEAPPAAQVMEEMERFVAWFNRTAAQGPDALPALTRASIAHLYFVSIHPFEDGNGRVGRAIVEKVLSQAMGRPTLIAMAQTISARKKAYYDALAMSNRSNEITQWLLYFSETILQALTFTQQRIAFLIAKTKFFDRWRGQLNVRQEKVLTRMFKEGVTGFRGGLSADNYLRITKTSRATATRDLQDLVAKGALTKTGERKHTRYYLKVDLET